MLLPLLPVLDPLPMLELPLPALEPLPMLELPLPVLLGDEPVLEPLPMLLLPDEPPLLLPCALTPCASVNPMAAAPSAAARVFNFMVCSLRSRDEMRAMDSPAEIGMTSGRAGASLPPASNARATRALGGNVNGLPRRA